MRGGLPSGTVTFLFTDIEGSTALLHRLGESGYAEALASHRDVVREAIARHAGAEVDTQGDAFFVAFSTARDALAAAAAMVDGLAQSDIRLRIGLHTGTPLLTDEGYVGVDVHRAARIAACGHGGQVLVSSATAALLTDAPLKDLGDHRLKDLSAPERVFQLGDAHFAPLRTLYRTNLPVPATPFVGRDQDVAALSALVADERLVTVAGPGGVGKTRLALQAVAAAADSFPDGTFWVALAPLREPALVLPQIAEALGSPDDVAAAIGDRALLLLLDNFEQVVDAAEDVRRLLEACPRLHIVVTSRQLLRIPGEQAYDVAGLAGPDAEALFVARARALDPAFEPDEDVVELCARLDDLPLALELAAARMRVLTPRQLMDRLAGRLDLLKGGRVADARQQTLLATIEWSHDLLDEAEKILFARVAVFAGGWALAAAEHVAGADVDTLESLVDQSLVRVRDGGRFWMLETIREYASVQLVTLPEADELVARHAEYFLAEAEEAARHLFESDRHRWVRRIGENRDNFRRAMSFFAANGPTTAEQRLVAAIGPVWTPLFEALGWVDRLLARGAAEDESPARAATLLAAARMYSAAGDPLRAAGHARDALELHERLGDVLGVAHSNWTLGYSLADAGDPGAAEEPIRASITGFIEAGEPHAAVWATRTLAFTALTDGRIAEGRALHEENLERARELGNRAAEATTLGALAMLAIDQERVDDALGLLSANLPLVVELDDELSLATNLIRIAGALASAGDPATAAAILAHALATLDELGHRPRWISRNAAEFDAHLRARLDERALEAAEATGRSMTRDDAIELARAALEQARADERYG